MSENSHGLTLKQILAHASDFDFYPKNSSVADDERKHFRVTVVRLSKTRFNVYQGAQIWIGDKWHWKMDWDSMNVNKNLKKYSYTLDEAISIALEQVEKVEVNGATYDGWQDRFSAIASKSGEGDV